jgi:hypothetical protein
MAAAYPGFVPAVGVQINIGEYSADRVFSTQDNAGFGGWDHQGYLALVYNQSPRDKAGCA